MLLFLRPVLYVAGLMQLIVAGFMTLPLLLELVSHGPDAEAFFEATLITGAIALSLTLSTHAEIRQLSVRQMFLLVVFTWGLTAITCTLPYTISQIDLTFTDALFEAVAGITTTNNTVIADLENQSAGLLLWRALTQWLGGISVVGMTIVLFPFMRIGGLQIFKSEGPDRSDRIFTQARALSTSLITVYLTISIISALLYHFAGLNWFDAITHMMATVSTGGFSTHNESLAYYDSLPVLWAAVGGMLLGALPFTWFMLLGVDIRRALSDHQVRNFIALTLLLALALGLWLHYMNDMPLDAAATHGLFGIVSMMTTTGLSAGNFLHWGGFVVTLFFILYFVGGCTGSTTGSLKIFRWNVAFISLRQQLLKMMLPHRVVSLTYNGKTFSDEVRDSVANFIILFVMTWLAAALALSATGLDPVTSISGALAALANTGQSLSAQYGPGSNFAALQDQAKWILSITMLIGRLEILVAIMTIMPSFWRD